MADPLKLLQEYASGKREIRELVHVSCVMKFTSGFKIHIAPFRFQKGKLYYVFGDIAYPHDAATNFQVYSKADEYYTIESILQLWKNQELQHNIYVKNVSGRGIQPVTRMQR